MLRLLATISIFKLVKKARRMTWNCDDVEWEKCEEEKIRKMGKKKKQKRSDPYRMMHKRPTFMYSGEVFASPKNKNHIGLWVRCVAIYTTYVP